MNISHLIERLGSNTATRVHHFHENAWRCVDNEELLAEVRRTCTRLRQWGVEAGQRVGIQGSNSYFWMVHDLALLELNAVSVVLPDHLPQSAAELVSHFELNFLLVSAADAKSADQSWIALMDGPNEGPKAVRPGTGGFDPDIFTLVPSSGTSGVVKTLIASKQGADQVISSFAERYPLEPGDRITIFLPLSNLQQRLIAFGALWFGLELVIATPHLLFRCLKEVPPTLFIAPPIFYEAIHRRFLTATSGWQRALAKVIVLACKVLPAGAAALVRRRLFGAIYQGLGGRMRWMITGMAHIRGSTLQFFKDVGLPLFEAYGLTECGLVAGNAPWANRLGSVGLPFEPGSVTLGDDGEILVKRRRRVATGYWRHDADDSRRVFLDEETVATGDFGRFDADGFLYLTGRKKEMIVTSGGVKVQPEELENTIRECPGVDHCAVMGNESLPHLVAVIRLAESNGPRGARIVEDTIAAMNRRLPQGAEIRKTIWSNIAFTFENGLLTRNLKLDRRRVFARFADQITGGDGASA